MRPVWTHVTAMLIVLTVLLDQWTWHTVQELFGEASSVGSTCSVDHLFTAVEISLETATQHLDIVFLLSWAGHFSVLNIITTLIPTSLVYLEIKLWFLMLKSHQFNARIILYVSWLLGIILHTYLVKCLDSELINIHTWLVLCLGLSHTLGMLQILYNLNRIKLHVAYTCHLSDILQSDTGPWWPGWCRCTGC